MKLSTRVTAKAGLRGLTKYGLKYVEKKNQVLGSVFLLLKGFWSWEGIL